MNINSFKAIYPFLQISSIGVSSLGTNIPAIRFGNGSKQVLYVGSTHANEWITSPLLMKFVEALSKAYVNNLKIGGANARDLFDNTSLYIVPMLNPDGVDLVTGNLNQNSYGYTRAKTISESFPDIAFPNGWKANIEGVDLNLQFPAGWDEAKKIKYAQGFTKPAPRDFVGYGPLTAPESLAIYNFILAHNISLMITYHTQGEVIYYQFQNYAPQVSQNIANQFANASGYKVENTSYESGFAGLKDWYVYYYRRPGFTIEAGLGENPLPISDFNSIYTKNLGILVLGMLQ
jgi:g-D-glutamyl-meso-diaminopimelate peptidase